MSPGVTADFDAFEYGADDDLYPVHLCFKGSERDGWAIERNGSVHLELGPGYRLVSVDSCGICSTDLARRFLPFPLPQVTGHELLARDERGRRCVVEINASHAARGVDDGCPFCAAGLDTHCPMRLVLGIHDLPGGFGQFVLAPSEAVVEVPNSVPDEVAVLMEPLAAALHAVESVAPGQGDTIALLGPRRLGLLCIAALVAYARRRGVEIEILALARRAESIERATRFGATGGRLVNGDSFELEDPCADVVIDTTGNPAGLELAVQLARREVHLKSTHGQLAGGLRHTTELVVDELSLERLPEDFDEAVARPFWQHSARPRVAWLLEDAPPDWLAAKADLIRAPNPRAAAEIAKATPSPLPRVDAAVVGSLVDADACIRPDPEEQESLLRPRGAVLLAPAAASQGSPLASACVQRGLVLSTSRCGDFGRALELVSADSKLRETIAQLVTHRFAASELARAFQVARQSDCIKAVIQHPESLR